MITAVRSDVNFPTNTHKLLWGTTEKDSEVDATEPFDHTFDQFINAKNEAGTATDFSDVTWGYFGLGDSQYTELATKNTLLTDYMTDILIDDSLISYYDFDTDGTDAVGTNDFTQITGGTDVVFTSAGKNGNAADAAGTDLSGLELPSGTFDFTGGTAPNGDKSFSFSFYAYLDADTNLHFVGKRATSTTNMEYSFTQYNSVWYASVNGPDNSNKYQTQWGWSPSISTWYHVVWTYDATLGENGQELWIDGVNQTPTLRKTDGTYTGMSSSTAKFTIFDPEWSSTYNMNGRLDGLGVWDKALSESEVAKIFNRQLTKELK